MEQFIDFCILCGCDYCDTIKGSHFGNYLTRSGIGPTTAYKLIVEHKNIEEAIKKSGDKYQIPENFPYEEARGFFVKPDILDAENIPALEWTDADEEGLTKFLVEDQSFATTRVASIIERLRKARKVSSQMRLDNFFGKRLTPTPPHAANETKPAAIKKKRRVK